MSFSLREYNKKMYDESIVRIALSLNKRNKIDKQLIHVVKSQENQSEFIKKALMCYIHILNGTNQPKGRTDYGIYGKTKKLNKDAKK